MVGLAMFVCFQLLINKKLIFRAGDVTHVNCDILINPQ
jgi:hypothetical protein